VLATVPGSDAAQTREAANGQVESVVGLLALCFGEQILGNPVFADYYFSEPTGEQGHIRVPVKHLIEVSIDKNFISPVAEALVCLPNSPISASVGIALRWYVAGLSAESLVDRFIAFFIGLEALSSGYFATIEPKPVRKEYTQLERYFLRAQPAIDRRLRDILLSRIADFPLSMKFQAYWKSRFGSMTRESNKFSSLNRLRSELLHGSIRNVSPQQVDAVKTLLEKLLSKEFGLETLVDNRQTGPKLLEFVLSYITMPLRETQG